MQFILPLNEIIVNFHDELKSITSGYGSFDYEDYGFQQSNIVRVSKLLDKNNIINLNHD